MPGQRDLGDEPVDHQDPEDEQDPAPDVRRSEGVQQGFEHGRLRVRCRLRRLGLGGGWLCGGLGRRLRLRRGRLGRGCARLRGRRLRLGRRRLGLRRGRLGRRGLGRGLRGGLRGRFVGRRSGLGSGGIATTASATGASSGSIFRAGSLASGTSRTDTVPPAASILARADALNASATTNRAVASSPPPRTFIGRSSRRTSPAARRISWLTVIGAVPFFEGFVAGHVPALELTELDEPGDVAEVHDLVLDLERVLEAAQLRDALVERRLAALEPGRDLAAGARLLALGAAARGLALARGDAASDATLRLAGPGRGLAGRGASLASPWRPRRPSPPRSRGSGPGGPCRGSRRWRGLRPRSRCRAARAP